MPFLPPALITVATRQHGLASTAQCVAAGLGPDRPRRLVLAGHWSRPTYGVYDLARTIDLPGGPDHERRRAAWLGLLAAGPGSISTGVCALALHGVEGLPFAIRPEATRPRSSGSRHRLAHPSEAEVRIRRFRNPLESGRLGSFRIANVRTALVQALPELDRLPGISILDHCLHQELLSPSDWTWMLERLDGRPGSESVFGWIPLLDARSESPLESRARVALHDAGLPPDDLQVEVHDPSGEFVARADMGWRLSASRWLFAEIDGREFHDIPEAAFKDRERQHRLQLLGHHVVRLTSADLRDPERAVGLVMEMLLALRAA